MALQIAALLLYITAIAFSEEPPSECTKREELPSMRELHCSATVKKGYLNALCNIFIGRHYEEDPHTEHVKLGDVLLAKLKLQSEKPVIDMTMKDELMCLSLRKIWVEKLDHFEGSNRNYTSVHADGPYFGPFNTSSIFEYARLAAFNSTFYKPPQVAVATCNETRPDGSCQFKIYGFLHTSYNSTSLPSWYTFFQQWGVTSSFTDTLNITFAEKLDERPGDLLLFLCVAPVKRLLLYKFSRKRIDDFVILCNGRMESILLVQSPIEDIEPSAFRAVSNVTYISLVGTKLSGIPLAIFELRRLDIFDMSHTDTPDSVDFDYCPANCSRNSTATRLVLSGSKLSMLPNRAFCAFPILEELALDSCHLLNIYGSPFQCLKRLKSLSLFGNNIEVLYGNSVNGLHNLVTLNISNNNIEYFQGSHILLTLASLRSLSLSNNLLTELNLRPQGEIMIEELNIERNNVKLWEPPLFSFMFKLKKLGLAHNNITKLDNKMLHDIRHVHDVELGWNQWDCSSCDLNNIHSLLHEHPPNCSKCFSCATPPELFGNDVRNVTLRDDYCSPEWYRVYVVPTLLCFMVATILASIAYRKRWHIMYALLYLRVTINRYRRQRNSDDFLFDGFLSYHASDGDWVRDVLLPKLESPPMQFRLCVAERDFIPGMQITENICRAIAHSRKSLFVISREFCRSRWCMFELSLAQHRLFESDLQDGLVFIKMNDVGESEMSSLLQYLTKSRTYVQIPEDGSSETLQNLFWLQLHAALKK